MITDHLPITRQQQLPGNWPMIFGWSPNTANIVCFEALFFPTEIRFSYFFQFSYLFEMHGRFGERAIKRAISDHHLSRDAQETPETRHEVDSTRREIWLSGGFMDSHQTTFERSCKTDPDYQDSSQEFWLGKIKGANKKGGGGGSHEAVGRPYGQQQMILRNLYTYTRQKSGREIISWKKEVLS